MPNYMTELSPDNNAHVYQIKDKEAAPIDLLKDTVGWVGKNELENKATTQTLNGVTYTVNADKSVTLSGGSASADTTFDIGTVSRDCIGHIASGISGGSATTYEIFLRHQNSSGGYVGEQNFFNGEVAIQDKGSSVASIAYKIRIKSGADFTTPVTFYPMIRDASIIDSTYEPYHKSVEEVVEQVYADNGVLGAKNFLVYPYNQTTKTDSGITFTDNGDGTVNIVGTATANAEIVLVSAGMNVKTPKGRYKLSLKGLVSGVKAFITAYNGTTYVKDIGSVEYGRDESEISLDYSGYDRIRVFIQVVNATAISSAITVYPMLRLASDPDSTYAPYAMTNRELTDNVVAVDKSNLITSTYTFSKNRLIKVGKIVYCYAVMSSVTANANDTIANIPNDFKPITEWRALDCNAKKIIVIDTAGAIKMGENISGQSVSLFTSWITS